MGVITSADIVELINDEEEELEEKKEIINKRYNWYELLAFALLLLLAINTILGIVPAHVLLQAAVIMVAIALEAYSHFVFKRQE